MPTTPPQETGAADLAERVNASHRFLYVDEIVAEAEPATVGALVAWGDRHGLNATGTPRGWSFVS